MPSDSKDSYSNPPENDEFQNFVSEVLDEFHTPGLAIAIVHKDKTWSNGFGYSDLKSKEPITPRTLFFTASTAKSFTAAAASKLVYSDDSSYKDIDWSTRLSDLIPDDFVLQDEYATKQITIADALSHRTGMPRHDLIWTNSDRSQLKGQVRKLRHVPMHNELRMKWEYCNLPFSAVSYAIETVTENHMSDLLRDWFWEPLGMHETFYTLSDAEEWVKKSNGEVPFSRSYLWDDEKQDYCELDFADVPPANGAGGIISNVLDYTNWVRQFLYPCSTNNTNTVGESAVKEMTTAHMPIRLELNLPYTTHAYGLGIESMTYRGYLMQGHRGAISGYMADMRWIPELEWGVVILQNSYSLACNCVAHKLQDDLLDSVVAKGEAFDVRKWAREQEEKAKETLGKGVKKVYPNASELASSIGPALPLEAYEGTYEHPAYDKLELSIASSSKLGKDQASADASRQLVARGSGTVYLDPTWTFRHVSGEHWWVYFKYGPPGFWGTDSLLKAKFEVGVDGKVEGLRLQAEPEMEELAWFEKVA